MGFHRNSWNCLVIERDQTDKTLGYEFEWPSGNLLHKAMESKRIYMEPRLCFFCAIAAARHEKKGVDHRPHLIHKGHIGDQAICILVSTLVVRDHLRMLKCHVQTYHPGDIRFYRNHVTSHVFSLKHLNSCYSPSWN